MFHFYGVVIKRKQELVYFLDWDVLQVKFGPMRKGPSSSRLAPILANFIFNKWYFIKPLFKEFTLYLRIENVHRSKLSGNQNSRYINFILVIQLSTFAILVLLKAIFLTKQLELLFRRELQDGDGGWVLDRVFRIVQYKTIPKICALMIL